MDVGSYNRDKSDGLVATGSGWTIPVSTETIAAARRGQLSVTLTETKPVPHAWFPPLEGLDLLGLASGGGQQGPVFAALGARVTILDFSARQLERDREVAEREGLTITLVEGDMRDLSMFDDASFDLVFHPCSNGYVPDVHPVWRETFRVLRPGGILLAGSGNPAAFVFDDVPGRTGELRAAFRLPFDASQLSQEDRLRLFGVDQPLEFSHSLEDLVGGQLEAGFSLSGLYEDTNQTPLGTYLPLYLATRAVKPHNPK